MLKTNSFSVKNAKYDLSECEKQNGTKQINQQLYYSGWNVERTCEVKFEFIQKFQIFNINSVIMNRIHKVVSPSNFGQSFPVHKIQVPVIFLMKVAKR